MKTLTKIKYFMKNAVCLVPKKNAVCHINSASITNIFRLVYLRYCTSITNAFNENVVY